MFLTPPKSKYFKENIYTTLHRFNHSNQIFMHEEINTIDVKYYSLHVSALLRCHLQGIHMLKQVGTFPCVPPSGIYPYWVKSYECMSSMLDCVNCIMHSTYNINTVHSFIRSRIFVRTISIRNCRRKSKPIILIFKKISS